MTVTVTNQAPDFKSSPNFKAVSIPYKLHALKTLSLPVPLLYDFEGLATKIVVTDTPSAGATSLSITHDTTANMLNIVSTKIQNCGAMDQIKKYGQALHTIKIRVQDPCKAYTEYTIAVEVYNTAPKFSQNFIIMDVNIPMNTNKQIVLTSADISDTEGDPIQFYAVQILNSLEAALPPMITLIQPLTIQIWPTSFSDVGIYEVMAVLYDYGGYYAKTPFKLTVTNDPPVFLNNKIMIDQKIRFNNSFDYNLPPYADPEGSPVYLKLQSLPANVNIYSFVKIQPPSLPGGLLIYPQAWSQVGTFKVSLIMTDTNKATYYQWNLEVYNMPPYFFGGKKPENQVLRFNSTLIYPLPNFFDDEFNQIFVINKMPKFITYDTSLSSYVIAPAVAATDIGNFNVHGQLSDSKLKTDFKFSVKVFNEAPYFKQALVSQITVVQGMTNTYVLPKAEDNEQQNFKVTAQLNSGKKLPSFIVFSENLMQFDFSPMLLAHVGLYEIVISLDDLCANENKYSFKLNVLDPNKGITVSVDSADNKSSSNNMTVIPATFKIQQVSRDGKATIKISAKRGADKITKLINKETFSFVILSKDNQPVPFTIDSKDLGTATVVVQLKFKDPKTISSSTSLDKIEARVINDTRFQSTDFISFLAFDLKADGALPPQVSKSAANLAAKFKGGIQLISSTAVTGGMVLNLSMSFLIQYLWGFLNDMSFLTINAMISITVPGTAKLIQMALLNFIYLDLLQTELWLIPIIYKKDYDSTAPFASNGDGDTQMVQPVYQDEPLNDYFDENGFSSKSLIKNLGSTFVYFVILTSTLILIPVLSFWGRCSRLVKRLYLWVKKHMIWNATLRFMIQQAPPISIASGINFFNLSFKSADGKTFSSILSCLFLGFIIIAKFFIFFILKKYQRLKQLRSKRFEELYGTLIYGLNLKSQIGIYWSLLILIRWGLTNAVIIIFRDNNYAQIISLMTFSYVFQILIIIGKPFNDKIENRTSLFNEVMVSAYLYVLIMLTDFTGENNYREQQGTVLVVIIMTNVIVNLLKFFFSFTFAIRNYCKRRLLMRMQQRSIDEYNASINQQKIELENIIKLLSNPQLMDPEYIPTIEEEQALANRKLLFQGDIKNQDPEIRRLINLINGLRFGINRINDEETNKSGFGKIIQNWKGVNDAELDATNNSLLDSSMTYNKRNSNFALQMAPQLPFQYKAGNVKKKQKKSKNRKGGKKKVKQNGTNKITEVTQWNFEDDYFANQDFETIKRKDLLIQPTSLGNINSIQEQKLQQEAFNKIQEEDKLRQENPKLKFMQTNPINNIYEREMIPRYY